MNILKIIESISFIIIVLFAIIGTIVVSIVFHELSHYSDFHQYVTKDDICVLNVPTTFDSILVGDAGWYSYYYNRTNYTVRDEIADTRIYTESKAYTITFLIMAFVATLLIIVIKQRIENNMKAEIYDQFLAELSMENPTDLNSLSG